MEIIVGRITADAKTYTLKDDRQVVNFSIAVNDSYKPKGSKETKKLTRFFKCGYWLNAGIAKHLTKGTLVELYGRIGADAYKDMQGEAKASLTMHVDNIRLHGGGKSQGKLETVPSTEETGDLPF